MRAIAALFVVALIGCDSTPEDPNQKLLHDLGSEEEKTRDSAAEGLRQIDSELPKIDGARAAISKAFTVDGSHRASLAMVLGSAWGESAVQELVAGLKKEGLVPVTSSDKAANEANRSIGTALKDMALEKDVKLGDDVAKAVALYAGSGDIKTALTFIELLGITGSKLGTDDLLAMIADSDNNFIVKNCVQALGNIRDPKSIDVLIEHMFRERTGVSFYAESSFALFQHGNLAELTPKLEAAFEGKNQRIIDMMKGSKACQDAKGVCYVIQAKVAEVMSDVGLTPEQVKKLGAVARGKEVNQQLVTKIIEALGRTGRDDAVDEIMKHKANLTVREFVGRAIARIGDRKAALALAKQGSHSNFLTDAKKMGYGADAAAKSELEIRRFTLENASRAGDASVTAELEKQAKAEKNPKIKAMIEQQIKRSKVYDKCKTDVACYRPLLASPEPLAREKAAYELAYATDEGSVAELVRTLDAAVDDTNESRFAKFWALWTIGPSKLKAHQKTLRAMAAKDKKNQDYIRIAAEVERLVDRIAR